MRRFFFTCFEGQIDCCFGILARLLTDEVKQVDRRTFHVTEKRFAVAVQNSKQHFARTRPISELFKPCDGTRCVGL